MCSSSFARSAAPVVCVRQDLLPRDFGNGRAILLKDARRGAPEKLRRVEVELAGQLRERLIKFNFYSASDETLAGAVGCFVSHSQKSLFVICISEMHFSIPEKASLLKFGNTSIFAAIEGGPWLA